MKVFKITKLVKEIHTFFNTFLQKFFLYKYITLKINFAKIKESYVVLSMRSSTFSVLF